jgi:hypothetical protein
MGGEGEGKGEEEERWEGRRGRWEGGDWGRGRGWEQGGGGIYVCLTCPSLLCAVKDYAKLNEKEWAALSEESADLGKQATMGYSTAIPAGHPFAHARVLNVVAKCKSIGATTAVRT